MVTASIITLAACIVLQRLAELRVAAANRKWALAAGGREYSSSHYPWFFLLHIGWLVGWLLEAYYRQEYSAIWFIWLTLFGLAQALRYWCISSLGRCWNTRILVVPGMRSVRRGPFRYIRHPNYLAVAIELASVPLLFNAWITAVIAGVLNAILLLGIRIPAEEAALDQEKQ